MNNNHLSGFQAYDQVIKQSVANQSLKDFTAKVIQSNSDAEFFARRVLNNYPLDARPVVLDRLVELVLCDEKTFMKVYDATNSNPSDFFMLNHAHCIREKLGINKELTLATCPF